MHDGNGCTGCGTLVPEKQSKTKQTQQTNQNKTKQQQQKQYQQQQQQQQTTKTTTTKTKKPYSEKPVIQQHALGHFELALSTRLFVLLWSKVLML